jgi:hypothetical protein
MNVYLHVDLPKWAIRITVGTRHTWHKIPHNRGRLVSGEEHWTVLNTEIPAELWQALDHEIWSDPVMHFLIFQNKQ